MVKQALLALILLFFTNNCGGRLLISECDLFETGGLTICSLQPVNAADVEQVIQAVELETAIYYPQVIGLSAMLRMHGVTATFLDVGGLAENCHETGYDGLYACEELITGQTRNGDTIIVEWHPCLARTALAHELLHTIQYFDLGSSDSEMVNHSTPWLFRSWTFGNNLPDVSVEERVYEDIALTLESCR